MKKWLKEYEWVVLILSFYFIVCCLAAIGVIKPSNINKEIVSDDIWAEVGREFILDEPANKIDFVPDEVFVKQSSQQIFIQSRQTYIQPKYNYPRIAENGSYYGQISTNTGRPKTVSVRGYYRKDGTYVRGHYRSQPRR